MKEERQNTPMNAIQPPAHKRSVWIDSYQIPVYTDLKRADEILYATDTQILGKPKKNYFAMVDLGAPTEEVVSGELKKRSFNVLSGATENALTPWRRVLPESFRRGAEAAVINTARQAGAFSIKTGLALMNKMGEAAAAGTGGAYIPTEADRQRAQEEYQRSQKWADDFNNKVKAVVGLFTKRAGLEKTQKDGFLYDLGSGAGSVLTSIAALAITRNPAIMSAIFGAAEGQGTYEQAIEAGVEPVKAYKLGLSNAAWIAATEFVGDKLFLKLLNVNGVLDKFTSKALKSIKKKPLSVQGGTAAAIGAARGGMIEGVQEATQSIGSNVINDVGGVEDTSWREKAKQALYEGFIAFILGGVPGGAAAGGNFFVYRQNIAKNLMAAGVKEEEAHKVATELANTAISEDFTKEALGSVSGEINSPLTAEDRDAGTFKATLTQAQQRKVEHNAWDAREQLKKEAQEAGMSEEEAEQTAEIAHANQLAFYRLTGIAPEEMRYMKIDVLGPSQTEQSPLVYNQAAMYRNPARSLAEFVEFYNQNKENPKEQNKSFYRFSTASGAEVDVPFNRVKHIDKRHSFSKEQWSALERSIDNLEYAYYVPGVKGENDGVQFLCKINTPLGKAGVTLEVLPNGRVLLDTAVFDSSENIDNWAKNEPLQRPSHKKPVLVGSGIDNSIAGLQDFVKTQEMFAPDNNTLLQEGKNLFAPDETVARKFKADVKAVLSDKNTPNNTKVDMGVIPPLYEKLGLPKQELKTNKLALRKALGLLTQEELKADKNLHNHNVPQEVVENLPKLLADPVAVFRSNTKPGAYVAVLNEKAGKDQIVAILRPSPKENGFTFIPTVYEHGKFDKFVESTVRKNNVVYIDKNRMSLPEPLIQAGTIGKNILTNSIRTKEDFVNPYLYFQQPNSYDAQGRARTDTPQFKAWFAGSKVVDENGEPLVVYHGTKSDFGIFDLTKGGRSNEEASIGFWFSPSKDVADNFVKGIWYGDKEKKLMPLYLNLKNPKIYEAAKIDYAALNKLNERITSLEEENNALYNKTGMGNIRRASSWMHLSEEDFLEASKYMDKEDAFNARKFLINEKELAKLRFQKEKIVKNDAYHQYQNDLDLFSEFYFHKYGSKDYVSGSHLTGAGRKNAKQAAEKLREKLIKEGYDGIIIKDTKFDAVEGKPVSQIVAFFPEQIKSVYNRGTWDADNPNIYYQTAYHGSPHEFTRFSTDAIGTVAYAQNNQNPSFAEELDAVLKAAPNQTEKAVVGRVSPQLSTAAKEHGLNIDGYVHNIDTSAVRHIINRHGNEKQEAARGQIAITGEDFKTIPEIIYNPDFVAFGGKNAKGKDLIVFGKNMPDGSSVYVEEIRTGKKTLTTSSMRKYKSGMDSSSFAKRISNAHSTNPGTISIVGKEDFVNTWPDNYTLGQEGENLFAPSQTSLNTYKEDLKKAQAGTLKTGQLIRIGRIGLYERLGFAEKPFGLSVNVLKKITEGKHNVKIQDIENLPQLIADPVAVFKSRTDQNSLVAVVSAKDNSNRQVITILRDTQGKINVIPSMYGKDNFNSFVASNIKEGNLIYIDEEKALKTIRPQELQLLKEDSLKGSIYNIRRKEEFVNALPDNYTLGQEGENLFAPDTQTAQRFKAQVRKALSDQSVAAGALFDMGNLPAIYVKLGLPHGSLKTNKTTLLKATGKAGRNLHKVPQEVLENLPALVADPKAVFKSSPNSTNPNGYVVVLDATNDEGKQIIAAISPNKKGAEGFSFIPSVYDKGNFENFVRKTAEEGGVLYIKEKDSDIWGPLQSRPLHNQSPTNSIRTKEDFVKGKLLKYNKNYQAKQEYYQSRPEPRGSVTIDEEANRAIIKIFQKGDASTIVHELAHVQLAMLARARGVSADEEFAQLTADLDAWLGAPEENGRYSTPQQEKFAQGFEGYLAAGKAPNKQLESVFEKFAQWLAEIYQAAKEYLKITPEVKSIFDRLLAPQAQIQKSKIGSKLDAAKKLVEQMKRGQGMDFEGLSIQDIKELLKTLSVRKPAAPKQDLLKDLRKHGAEYANAGKIDKEAYKNAKIYDKKGGVDDRPDVWLQKHGYMEFEESTEETLAAAYDLIQRALAGEKVYRIEDQVVAQARAAFEENMATILQLFPDIKTAQETLKSIAQLEKMGYRAVEAKDLELLRRTLSNLETMAGQVEAENTKLSADAVEKKRQKFEQDALRIKKRVMTELDKRQLAHKEDMKKLLKHAKTPQEIHDVLTGILEQMEAAWAQTDEGKRDLRKLAVPDTNWDKVRVELLKRFNDIAAAAQEEVRQAQQTLSKLPLMGFLSEEQAAAKEKAEKVLKESNLDGKYVMAMQAVLRGIPHITYADVAKYSAVLARSNKRYRLLTEKNINEFINHAKKMQERNYKKYMRGKLSALFNRKTYEKLGSVKRAKYTPYMLKFLEDASKIWGGSQQAALRYYEAAVESIDPDNPPSVFQALINRVLWIKADPGGEVTMQDLHAFYEDALAAVRGDAAQKRLDGERRALQEANIRLAACLSLKERKLPKGIVTYLLHGGVDLQTFIDIAFGQYETDMYESDPLPSRAEQSLAALKKIAAGSEEETVPGLRPDFVQYGGTPDVTFIWGDNNKGLQHIAQKHGADILPQVIDTVVAGRVERFTASKKTLVLQKGNIEAVLSLDEHGKQKTWLLTGWDATSPKGNKKRTDANGQVSTGSAATQTLPTFSRQDLGAVLNNSIAQKEGQIKAGKRKINFRDVLAPETNQIKEAVFNAQINKDILRAVGTAYQLKTSQQILDKIAEMQKDTMQLTNYAFVKDQANGEVIATLFKNGKPLTYNVPRVQTINRLEALTFWIWNQNHIFVDTANGAEDYGLSGRLHYAYGSDQLGKLLAWLTPQDVQAAKNLQGLVEKHYEQESQVHQRIYGFKLPKVEFYFPSVTERITDTIDLKQEFVQNSKSPSFIKKRVTSRRVIQRIVNPIDLALKHLRRAGEFIFEAENYAANKRIFKDRDVESAFLEKFGQQDGKKLYSKFMALLDQQAPQKAQVKDEFYSVMNKLFNGWVKAVMGLKPITGIKQFASSVSFAENMPWDLWTKWFAEGLTNPRKTADFMLKASPYIQARYDMGGMNEYTARAMASDEVAPIKSRWNTFTNFMLINTRLGDKASLIFGGYPYMKYLLEVKGLSQQEAARVFEKQATRTLQSSLRVHLSQGQANADSFGARVFLVFKNQQLQYVRKVVDAYVQFKNGEISQSKFAKTAFIYLILNPMVYTALTLGWFAADDDDWEEDLKNLLTSPVSQFFGAYPFGEGVAGFFVDNAASLVSEGKLTAPRQMGLPMFDDITRDVAKAVRTVNADELDTMGFINIFLAVAKYTGLPTQSVMNMGGGLVDIVTGKPVRGSLRAVGYTQNRAGKITGDKE